MKCYEIVRDDPDKCEILKALFSLPCLPHSLKDRKSAGPKKHLKQLQAILFFLLNNLYCSLKKCTSGRSILIYISSAWSGIASEQDTIAYIRYIFYKDNGVYLV